MSVGADCNRCIGGCETNGNALSINLLACTRTYCGPESSSDVYVTALLGATSFRRLGNELEITYSGGTMRLHTE